MNKFFSDPPGGEPHHGDFTRNEDEGFALAPALRFLLYSHDSWGLGHLKRSLTIAEAISRRFKGADVLIVTGSPCATQFELPPNCDVLKLPSISKDVQGRYISRSLSGDVAKSIELRSKLILESYRSFDPHIVLVDHQLTGLNGEALGMLHEARSAGKTLVYGMRDVLDAPEAVAREWARHESHWALKKGYDLICVYGSPDIFDPREKYPLLQPVRGKIHFSGYVISPPTEGFRAPVPPPKQHVLVTVGGGEDGQRRIDAYFEALALKPFDWTTHVITGPLMDVARVRHYKRLVEKMDAAESIRVSRFHDNLPHLLQSADAVLSMAGYNSCTEILQSRVPAVLLPRSHPRKEQLIRARRLADLGLVRCLESEDAADIREAVETALAQPDSTPGGVNLDGVEGVCDLLGQWMDPQPVLASPPSSKSADAPG